MKISRVGVDLAKNVFQVHGVDPGDHPVWQRKLARGEWIRKLTDKVQPGGIVYSSSLQGATEKISGLLSD